MAVQLARPFLDLFWLNGSLNSGQICNTHSRTKNEASSMSIPWWQCITVAWNRTASVDCLDAYIISRYGDFCANDNDDDTTDYFTPCACARGN